MRLHGALVALHHALAFLPALSTAPSLLRSCPSAYLLVVLLGDGQSHNGAYALWLTIAKVNPRVKVVSFAGETNSKVIGDTLSRITLY